MDHILNLLEGIFYLATTAGDQPHVRPFDGVTIIDHKVYIGTSTEKSVYHQIVDNPKVEIFAMGPRGQLRITAEAYPVTDRTLSDRAYSNMGKEPGDTSISLELQHIDGYVKLPSGEKVEISI